MADSELSIREERLTESGNRPDTRRRRHSFRQRRLDPNRSKTQSQNPKTKNQIQEPPQKEEYNIERETMKVWVRREKALLVRET